LRFYGSDILHDLNTRTQHMSTTYQKFPADEFDFKGLDHTDPNISVLSLSSSGWMIE